MGWMKKLGLVGEADEGDGRELPDFEAISHDGEPRGRDDLLGSPSVLWFYPAASTPG